VGPITTWWILTGRGSFKNVVVREEKAVVCTCFVVVVSGVVMFVVALSLPPVC
jgi:hypothetical protein